MADLKKFLDQSGVSILWSKVAENIKAEEERAKLAEKAAQDAAKKAQDEVDALETLVGVLPEGTDAKTVVEYVNKKTEGIATDAALAELQGTVDDHTEALTLLNGDAETKGSVANTATSIATTAAANKVAEIVAGANADFDTLKEIADWILNDTTGAANMANDIAALETKMNGVEETVVKSIASAIEEALMVNGANKYALATELSDLADRVKALEDADLDTRVTALEDKFGEGEGSVADQIADAKQEAIDAAATDAATKAGTAETNAKAYADGLAKNYATAVQGEKADSALQAADITTGAANGTIAVKGTDVAVKGLGSAAFVETSAFDAAGTGASAADQALVDAKAYTDTEVAKIQALTEAEIDAAIAAGIAQNANFALY